ncbi:TIGR00282 family metallophosphoesterase [Mycoplasma yeatsii]|uniref:TIGR00282 family metallophosphoesterase n=1 Tax=Mycoplasma yeatsii TaxID=51365 RepID=UPI0005B24F3C|nr:TIGR00282 family metallophosphoesterase [Mycoplasma yeatsii]AJM72001.1 metallophosphoesterase [Mycoplasma yeatsii GM274B]
MKILMIGDVYASCGRNILAEHLPKIVKEHNIDFVVVNGENTTHGKSLSKKHYDFYKQLNIDVITSGNHIFKNKEVLEYINSTSDLLKPMNMSDHTPGKGYVIVHKNNKKIAVVNLMGQSFMDQCDNPYKVMDEFLSKKYQYDILLVDFHAETTAEKIAFAWNYDGIITAFVGTHTHVQTADERILPKSTAFITDLGMTGAIDSVIGVEPDDVIFKQKTGLPVKFRPASGRSVLNAVVIEIDDKTNKAIDIKRLSIKH